MRPKGDHRPDFIFKYEIVSSFKDRILFAIDDTKDADSQGGEVVGATVKPTESDISWVNAIKSGQAKLEDLTNPQYREYIGGLI